MNKWGLLVLGSIVGGAARFVLSSAIYHRWHTTFPVGTLIVNLTGCLLIGFFNAMSEGRFGLGVHERLFLLTGFCGAYTTFSTFILETSNLFHDGANFTAWVYLLISCAAGFLLFRMGGLAGKSF